MVQNVNFAMIYYTGLPYRVHENGEVADLCRSMMPELANAPAWHKVLAVRQRRDCMGTWVTAVADRGDVFAENLCCMARDLILQNDWFLTEYESRNCENRSVTWLLGTKTQRFVKHFLDGEAKFPGGGVRNIVYGTFPTEKLDLRQLQQRIKCEEGHRFRLYLELLEP